MLNSLAKKMDISKYPPKIYYTPSTCVLVLLMGFVSVIVVSL